MKVIFIVSVTFFHSRLRKVRQGGTWDGKFRALFEGVCVNYRHPDPRRGEPRVGSALDVAFPADPVDPVDPLQSSVRPPNALFYNTFGTFRRNWGPIFGPNP